jgi:uncharacterized membrane protein YedE/YeeE
MGGLDLTVVLDALGDGGAAAAAGGLVGLLFGAAAQRSRFCLRAACVEFGRGAVGERVSVWLLCFATALFWTQLFDVLGWADLHASRFLAVTGSVSGALVGGAMLGWGLVMARGCPGRLLVLASAGNLRALLTGLVFVATAQMAFSGALAPLRQALALGWTAEPSDLDLAALAGFGRWTGVALGAVLAALALWASARNGVSLRTVVFGSGVGLSVGAGWLATSLIARQAFEPVVIESIGFSSPSARALMVLLDRADPLDFGVGLVCGVVVGAGLAARLAGEWRFSDFDGAPAMRRHITGAALMGFGTMLAGGCTIGAGVSGAATLALTPWLALGAMWLGAIAADRALDRPGGALAAA